MTSAVNGEETGETMACDDLMEEKMSWGCWIRTFLAGSGAMMVFVFTAITEAQSAVMLPQLKEKGSHIHVGPEEETWIGSLGILMAPISGLFGGPIVDAFGRKRGIQLFYLCMGLGFGVIACATEVYHIYIGRCICALAVGLEVVSVVYLAEICTKRQRSIFFSVLPAVFSGGVTLSNIIGGYLPWPVASAIFSLGCLVFFIVQCFSPESPAWLYKTGRADASTKSLERLGRSPTNIALELAILKLSSKEENEKLDLKVFLEPTVWKPYLILSLYYFFQCGAGVFDVLYYTVDFVGALGTTFDPLNISILLSMTRLVTTATAGIYFTAVASRKFATAFSGFWMAVALAGTGAYEFIYRDVPKKPFDWLPIALMVVNVAAGAVGVTCIPVLMAGEVFPLRVRGTMSGATFLVGCASLFIFVKIYGFCIQVLRIWGTLFLYAGFSFLCFLLGVFLLPETQNKTLYEIESSFLPKKKKRLAVEALKQEVESISSHSGIKGRSH